MPKEEKPKIEEVADQGDWENADVVYEFKDGAFAVGQLEIHGLGHLAKFEMTSEEEDRFFKLIHHIFAVNRLQLEERAVAEDIGEEEPVKKVVRKIKIYFSPKTPTSWFEEYLKELPTAGELTWAGVAILPDLFLLQKMGKTPPLEGFIREYNGSVIIYPNNISDKVQLYVTVFHELAHLIQKWQGKSFVLDVPVWAKYGEEPCEIEAENAGEKAAEILMGLRQYKEYKRRQKEAGKGPRDFS